jgi:hypothetical protein
MKKLEMNQMESIEGGRPTYAQIAGCTIAALIVAPGGPLAAAVFGACVLQYY